MKRTSTALNKENWDYDTIQSHKETNEMVQVVRRADIPSLHSVSLNDKTYYLGVLKDFHKHPALDQFVPKEGRLSMSWVHLGKNEMLHPHIHPIKSMIIICRGQTETLGELSTTLHEGDILIVPPHCEHGFIGSGNEGFWGISIQFEQRGLYEDPSEPLAEFVERPNAVTKVLNDNECINLSSLLKINESFKRHLATNPLFSFLKKSTVNNEALRDEFLDYFQVWSDAFQRMVLVRSTFCENAKFRVIAEEHLAEEFGHNNKLASERKNLTNRWDAILSATANWFSWKVMSIDELERIVLVHLVVEASATVFYNEIPRYIGKSIDSCHFADHRKLDVEHELMGISLLEGLSPEQYVRLGTIQQEGWDMLYQLYQRIYELISKNECDKTFGN
jgi:quercetin dioxygenase-like cupin family protein